MVQYNEIGMTGHGSVRTEVEHAHSELSLNGWAPMLHVRSVYVRVRMCGHEFIMDSHDGLKHKRGKAGLRMCVGVVSSL